MSNTEGNQTQVKLIDIKTQYEYFHVGQRRIQPVTWSMQDCLLPLYWSKLHLVDAFLDVYCGSGSDDLSPTKQKAKF